MPTYVLHHSFITPYNLYSSHPTNPVTLSPSPSPLTHTHTEQHLPCLSQTTRPVRCAALPKLLVISHNSHYATKSATQHPHLHKPTPSSCAALAPRLQPVPSRTPHMQAQRKPTPPTSRPHAHKEKPERIPCDSILNRSIFHHVLCFMCTSTHFLRHTIPTPLAHHTPLHSHSYARPCPLTNPLALSSSTCHLSPSGLSPRDLP